MLIIPVLDMLENGNEASMITSSQESDVLLTILGFGLAANILALVSLVALVKLNKSQSMAMNVLTIALIITDLLGLLTVSLPTLLSYSKGKWLGGVHLCHFQSVMKISCILASGCLSTVIASDRLTAIQNPFFYQKYFTHKQSRASIGYAWVLSLVVSVLPLFGFGGIKRYHTYCTINWFATTNLSRIYTYFFGIFGVMLVAVVVMTNIRIAMTGFSVQLQRRPTDLRSEVSLERRIPNSRKQSCTSTNMKKQIGKIAIAISFLFPITWLPFMVSFCD